MELKRDELRHSRRVEVRQVAALMPAAKTFLQFFDGWAPILFALRTDKFQQADILRPGATILFRRFHCAEERGIYATSSQECREAFSKFESPFSSGIEAA